MINAAIEAVRQRIAGVSSLYSTKAAKGVKINFSEPVVSVASLRSSGSRLKLLISVIIKNDDNVTLHNQVESVFLALNNHKINDGVVVFDSGEIMPGTDGFYASLIFQYTALVLFPTEIIETNLLGATSVTFNENCES